jgi:hypothetical protein
MKLVTKNKDIYERILNGDLNFSEGEIQLWGAMLCDEKFLLRLEKLNIESMFHN